MRELTRIEWLTPVGGMVLGAALFAGGTWAGARAQQRPHTGPTPLPKIGAACPSGYNTSGGYCVPDPTRDAGRSRKSARPARSAIRHHSTIASKPGASRDD